jgi:non-specific serine/threonine protein kinase/serine/threonine-protein kinase
MTDETLMPSGGGDATILPSTASQAAAMFGAPPKHLPPGSAIRNFTVTRVLGEGGFGVVYEAEQVEPVRRTVALKLLKPGMDTAEVLIRFEAERQALARMEHPGVAKVLDAGVTPDGRPFFAMEFVRGQPMLAFADRERLTVAERIDLAIKVCEAIQHAHTKGVVHRDLKPANILCLRTEGGVVPKVIDFGIAKATTERLSDSTMVTMGGELMGTPDYMSPEQADGADIDTRVDVYSLGASFYELFSGLLPFDPTELRAKGMSAMRERIMHEAAPRPSERLRRFAAAAPPQAAAIAAARQSGLEPLLRDLRDDLDWICLRCLEKDRDLRYASPSELATDLKRHQAHLPVSAGPPSRAYLVRKFVARHRIGVSVAAVGVAALVVAAVTFASLYRRAEEQRRLADDTLQAFQQSIAAVDPTGGRATASMGALDFLGLVEAELVSRLQAQPRALAAMRQSLAVARISFKDGAGAGRLLEEVVAERRREVTQDGGVDAELALAEALHNLGRARYYENRFDDALAAYSEALELRRRAHGGLDSPDVAMTLQHLAAVNRRLGKLPEAMELIDRSVAMWTRLAPDSLERFQAVNNRGTILEQAGRLDDAERDFLDALGVMERSRGVDDPLVARTLMNVAQLRIRKGQPAEAVAPLERALAIYELRLGAEHADTKSARRVLGEARVAAGQLH